MNSSSSMYQILGLKKLKHHVGIEIEVEYDKPKTFISPVWLEKSDGSLRHNGYEYITRGPMNIVDVPKALKEVTDFISNSRCVVLNSPRTSVHVHSNILNKTFLQTMNQVVISWMLENAMIKFCNPRQREGNLFCLRITDAENIVRSLQSVLDSHCEPSSMGRSTLRTMKGMNIRYAATNVRSISELGTIEYRGMAGNTYDYNTILRWVKAINTINENSDKFFSPEDVMNYYYLNGAYAFLNKCLGDSASIITESSMNYEELIKAQEGLVMPFAYRYDWENLSKKVSDYSSNAAKVRKELEGGMFNQILDAQIRPVPVAVHDEMMGEDDV